MSKKDEIKIRWNWKIFWMVLAIVFFFLWILNLFSNVYEIQQFEDLQLDCENSLKDLHFKWENAYNTLNNCYENNIPSCTVTIPSLK